MESFASSCVQEVGFFPVPLLKLLRRDQTHEEAPHGDSIRKQSTRTRNGATEERRSAGDHRR